MSTSPPAIQHLARQLLARDAARLATPHDDADRAVRACEKLRGPLSKLAGTAGYASLLSRALALAERQDATLKRLRVEANGSLLASHNEEVRAPGAAREGGAILIAELLNLLVMLIGEPLTLRLVREAWPNASIESLTQRTEDKP